MDMMEYLDTVNEFAEELYELRDFDTLDALEVTVMSVCSKYGVELYIEEWDTG